MRICPACDRPTRIHCGSLTCDWVQCTNEACVWSIYDTRRRRRCGRGNRVEPYTPTTTPEETP